MSGSSLWADRGGRHHNASERHNTSERPWPRGQRAGFPEYHPLAVHPEPGGFLLFADSIDGDRLCRLTEGATPDDWPLIVVPRHADQGPPLGANLTDTLLEWPRGRFATEGLPPLGRRDENPLGGVSTQHMEALPSPCVPTLEDPFTG